MMPEHKTREGLIYALLAYLAWGVVPVYFKFLQFAGALEILAHRVVWSVVLLALLLTVTDGWRNLHKLRLQQFAWLLLSTLLICTNWGVFIWALLNEQIVATSLGYFMNPLVTVALGAVFLHERIRPLQGIAITIASVGVLNEIINAGDFPWIGLTLAISFGFYGLVRKKLALPSLLGLGIETSLVLPLAVAYLIYLFVNGQQHFGSGEINQSLLLMAGGIVTTFPLVCFGAAAVRLPLAVLGMFQYLAPSISLVLAIYVYGEPFSGTQLITFGCIWCAVVLYSGEAFLHRRKYHSKSK